MKFCKLNIKFMSLINFPLCCPWNKMSIWCNISILLHAGRSTDVRDKLLDLKRQINNTIRRGTIQNTPSIHWKTWWYEDVSKEKQPYRNRVPVEFSFSLFSFSELRLQEQGLVFEILKDLAFMKSFSDF